MAKTRAALDALDPGTRVAMEGHRPGTYVRVVLPGVPCELVQVSGTQRAGQRVAVGCKPP